MKLYAILNKERIITAVLMREEEPTEGLWVLAADDSSWATGGHVAEDGTYTPPPPPPGPPPEPIVLTADVLFFERMTDDEYDGLDTSIRSGETARVYRGWAAATSFTEGTDLWALLVKHLTASGVSKSRQNELLARP